MKTILLLIFCCALPIAVIALIFAFGRGQIDSSSRAQDTLLGESFPIIGKNHVPEGTRVTIYNSNPPTSGDHWPQPAELGIYLSPLPDEQLVHNLEHGGIWISYKDLDNDAINKLDVLAKKYPQAVIITPRVQNENKIALASWGRLDTFDVLDIERIEKFIQANINKSPEPLAGLGWAPTGALAVGAPFPDFTVTEVDGRTITNESLKGKPTIVWFTTSWCVPCQIGAREVTWLDDELGDKAFEVLVIFVDPRESNADLVNWRENFANPDWMVAFDNELTKLAAKVNLKFLDSKFLLDKKGIIKNIDFKIADEDYLNVLRQAVEENL